MTAVVSDNPAAEAAPAEAPQYRIRMDDPDIRWYAVHTLTGHEHKVKGAIERTVAERGLEREVITALVPAEQVTTQTKTGKGTRKRIFFPGYILIQMKLTDQTWALIRRTSGVTGFVGSGNTPTPLSDAEVQVILDQLEGRTPHLEVQIDFTEGDVVNITSGPFANFTGVVEEIYPDRRKCKVMVTVFGRATAVELDIAEVAKRR